ncbi:hypothetical protein CLAIMM_08396 [Cladophialophora immunda]|nr:hypothetical protein CLAIMM_08396 [Cladophialophora immunda]
MGSLGTVESIPAHSSVHTPDIFRLNCRTIIVTGAVGGLGVQAVTAILESGGDVICLDRPEQPPQTVWDKLKDVAVLNGAQIFYYACDITDEAKVSVLFEEAASQARFPVRGLVTCAGITRVGPSIKFPLAEARRVIDINLIGTLAAAQATARIVQRQTLPASFVFIASMSGHIINKGAPNAAYCVSKAGVHQLARNLAYEWGASSELPTIRVNSISPGYIKTNMTQSYIDQADLEKIWLEDSMLKRFSEPEEYRGTIVYMLSDASSYMTGSDVRVDGGHTAC